MSQHALVLITCGSEDESRRISRRLVEDRLAAGVQMTSIESIYTWQGEVVEDREVLLIAKTRSEHFELIESVVVEMHSYDVPPILILPIDRAHQPYLDWIDGATGRPGNWAQAPGRSSP